MNNLSDPEIHAFQLDGFLNSLRCVAGYDHRSFGAILIDKENRCTGEIIDEIVRNEVGVSNLADQKNVAFKDIQNIFNKYIYSKLKGIERDSLKYIDWNLVEYYGLVSSAEDINGPWNRLVAQDSILVEYIDDHDQEAVIFFVEYESYILLTYLGSNSGTGRAPRKVGEKIGGESPLFGKI